MKERPVMSKLLISVVVTSAFTAAIPVPASALQPGQYHVGELGYMCLKQDGTWYGIDFAGSGHWINAPSRSSKAAVYGNYDDGQNLANGNFTLTVRNMRDNLTDWYSWHDDYSFVQTGLGTGVSYTKSKCDAPLPRALQRFPISSSIALGPLRGAASSRDKSLKPGQYDIETIQQICLVGDGTWYGTTFPMSGYWIDAPNFLTRAALYGNYDDGQYPGYGNVTITVRAQQGGIADWYDWHDDFSYESYQGNTSFKRVKKSCDPPANGAFQSKRARTE